MVSSSVHPYTSGQALHDNTARTHLISGVSTPTPLNLSKSPHQGQSAHQ